MVAPIGRDVLVEMLGMAAVQGVHLGMAWDLPDGSINKGEGIPVWTAAKAHTEEGHVTLHHTRDAPARFFVSVAAITRVWRGGHPDQQLWP